MTKMKLMVAIIAILQIFTPFAFAADDESPPLIQAAANGDGDEVRRLLRSGADANMTDEDGWTALDVAVQYDYPAIIDILANNGADVNRQDDDGWTALHFAAQLGRPASTRALIKNGARVNAVNTDKATPLHITARNKSWAVAEILIENRADVNRKDEYGDTPLHDAAWYDSPDVAEVLIEADADIDAENNEGRTPLYLAQGEGNSAVADLLIAADDGLSDLVAQKPKRKSTAQQVFERAVDSIVQIFVGADEVFVGSGVIIAPEFVATNCHVIGDATRIIVRTANEDQRINQYSGLSAVFNDGNSNQDLCLLEVEGLEAPENPIKIRTYDSLSIGEDVYAVGNPIGLDLVMSAGIIAQLRDDGQREIQTDAAISGGSSGGGLFDRNGNLVGLTTAGYVPEEGEVLQNLNFAIPADWILAYFTETE